MASEAQETGSRFSAKPIHGAAFGVEVEADLAAPFTDTEKRELRALYRQDGLIVLRGQDLTMDQQADACSIFGPVLRNSIESYLVSNVEKDGLLGSRELLFHNDVPYVPAPYIGGSLHALEVDDGVSATRFASALNAWDRLPDSLRARIEGRNALHLRPRVYTAPTRLTDAEPGDNCAVHAMVRQQEDTGRKYVFACKEMAALVAGLSQEDSDALLEELFAYLYAPDNVYEHVWTKGDIVIWDNLCVQHARSETSDGTRTLQRVTMAELSYSDQYPADMMVFDELREQAD